MFNLPQSTFGRRSFLRFSALSVAAGSFLMNPISKAVAQAVKEIEPFYWNACVINSGQRCPQRCFVKGGQVIRVETYNTAGDACDHRQIRACLRGRALRQRLYSPDRLKYPMKRVGERGEGKFERITWDEAIKTVADNLKRTVEKYGNESLYWQYCSGRLVALAQPHGRLPQVLWFLLHRSDRRSDALHLRRTPRLRYERNR